MTTHKLSLVGIIILSSLALVSTLIIVLAAPAPVVRATDRATAVGIQGDLTNSVVTYTAMAHSYTSTNLLAASPTLVSINPARNAITATLATSITAWYDQPMAASSVTSRTFVVHGMQSGVITAVHSLANANTLQVTPNRLFHQGELVYAIATTRTTNISGTAPLAGHQWQFNAGRVGPRCVGGFRDTGINLTGVVRGSAAWGDYDTDGDLDILLTGYSDSSTAVTQIYQNTGSGFSSIYAGSLTGVFYGSGAWGDYDNDGDLDILLTGRTESNASVSQIYQNIRTGFSQVYTGTLGSAPYGRSIWGDYDNDGDLDMLLSAETNLYQNTGSGFSVAYPGSLTGVWYSDSAWGDYDNDGDLDILLTGTTGSSFVAQIFQNTGSGFNQVYAGSLTGVVEGGIAWGDYDNDRDLDILLSGKTYSGAPFTQIYQNTGSGFSPVYTNSLMNVTDSSVAWGDYDNDGDLDILLAGRTESSVSIAQIYQNTGVGFSPVYTNSLAGAAAGSAIWGDYDNDGDLDILLTGNNSSYNRIFKIYRNEDCSDLSLTKTVTPKSAVSGQAITYTLTFSNAGSWLATGVVLTDIIPVSVTNVSVTSSGAAITNTGASPSYVWQVQDRNPGQVGIITLTGVLSSTLPPGVFTNTATIAGTGQEINTTNNSAAASLTHIARATITLTSTPNPSMWGQSVIFTASVTSTAGLMPTGSLTLTLDEGSLGPLTLTNGVATYTTTALAAGAHPVSASYNGDANHAASTSSTYTQTVNRAGTAISVASALNPSVYNQSVLFTVTVTSASGTPTGTVQFYADGAALGAPLNLAAGQALTSTTALVVGVHPITATYSGNSNYAPSTASALNQQVNKATATLTLGNLAQTYTGARQPITTTTSPVGLAVIITYTGVSGTTYGPSQTPPANAGTYSVIATVNDANYQGAAAGTLIIARASTTTTLTSVPNPALWGQTISFTATVTSAGGTPTGSITFTIDSATSNVALGANGQATYLTNTLAVGTHAVSTQYSGDNNFNISTGTLNNGQIVSDVSIVDVTAANSSPTTLSNATYFTATITAGSHVTYQWNFGDGATSSGANSTHTYASAGTYTASVTATNGAGRAVAQTTVYVTTHPLAQAGPDQSVRTGQPVTLNGSASLDPGNFVPLTYQWQQTGGPLVTLSGANALTATFTSPAIARTQVLTFVLTVTNALSLDSLPDEVVITVEPYRVRLPLVLR